MAGEHIPRRRICWPDPDATCLEGGCVHCAVHRPRSMLVIERWARKAGQVQNRYGGGSKDALEAFRYSQPMFEARWREDLAT